MKLYFSSDNAKLAKLSKKTGKKVYSLSLLSGHSCPAADICLAKAIQTKNGLRIKDGKNTKFRCFSASQETVWKNVYNSRKQNFKLIKEAKSKEKIYQLIKASLPKNKDSIIRIHVAGDMFCINYFDAWLKIARENPKQIYYCYTKQLNLWVKRLKQIPPNFILTASVGGKFDHLIKKYNLRHAKVVPTEKEAKRLGHFIDSDDSIASDPKRKDENFALLLHGIQLKSTLEKESFYD